MDKLKSLRKEINGTIGLMGPAIIETTRQDKQRKITANIYNQYSKTIFLKKNITTNSKQRQIKLKPNKLVCTSLENTWGQSLIRPSNK